MPKAAKPKTVVVSIRVREDVVAALNDVVAKHHPLGIANHRQLARRVVIDFAEKRLKYSDLSLLLTNPDAHIVPPQDAPSAPARGRGRKKPA